jgi:hypothetical protein
MLRRLAMPCFFLLLAGAADARPLPSADPATGVPQRLLTLQEEEEEKEREPGPADLEEAIEIALKRYGGRAAGADTVVREGRRVHEIRVLSEEGSVRTVRIDPETGAIIPQERRQD